MSADTEKKDLLRQDFIQAAKQESWPWIEQHLSDQFITDEDWRWAINNAEVDADPAVHRLGAMYLAISDRPFDANLEDRRHIELWHQSEPDIATKQHLSLALAKRPA